MRSPTTVTILEPWYGGSHKAWADGLQEHCNSQIAIIGCEASDWRWRLQASALDFAHRLKGLEPSDVLLTSSLVDVSTLKALLPEAWSNVPIAYYLHESQLLHPAPGEATSPRDAVMRNFHSMLVADEVLINSHSHLQQLTEALPLYFAKYGDDLHERTAEQALKTINVLSLGVDLGWCDPQVRRNEIPRILWNHRWDFDKDPISALRALTHAADRGLKFELLWLGENYLEDDRPVRRLLERLNSNVVQVGALQGVAYQEALHSCDYVISTAKHETFGIAAVEAIAAGCLPIFPERLNYPELLGTEHADLLYQSDGFTHALTDTLIDRPAMRPSLALKMRSFDWGIIAPLYDEIFLQLRQSKLIGR